MGLKDAVGILMRTGCTVTIRTSIVPDGSSRTYTFANHPSSDPDFGGGNTIHAHIEQSRDDDVTTGTTITIVGLSLQDAEAAIQATQAPPCHWKDPEGEVNILMPNMRGASAHFRRAVSNKKCGAFFVGMRWVATAKGGLTMFGYHIVNPTEDVRRAIDRDQVMKDGYKHPALATLLANAWKRCASGSAAIWQPFERCLSQAGRTREFNLDVIFKALPFRTQAAMTRASATPVLYVGGGRAAPTRQLTPAKHNPAVQLWLTQVTDPAKVKAEKLIRIKFIKKILAPVVEKALDAEDCYAQLVPYGSHVYEVGACGRSTTSLGGESPLQV
jgi:hypothetical protein